MTIYILRKRIKNNLELDFLEKVIKGLPIFQKHPSMFMMPKLRGEILKQFGHVCFKKHDTIFRIGDFGNLYFIVLKGSVYCLIPNFDEEQSQAKPTQVLRKKNQHLMLNGPGRYEEKIEEQTEIDFLYKNFPNMLLARTFVPG